MKNRIPLFVASLLLSVGTIGFTAGCAGTSTRESTGEYIDSAALTARVKAALAEDEFVRARDVNVETFRDTVQLSGFVDSEAQKDRAAEIARSVQGVQAVKNNITVKN
jgi:osmotically-inducible protein OsmY